MNKTLWPYLAATLVALIFSVHYLAAKDLMSQGIHPITLAALRGSIGGLVLLICFYRQLSIGWLKKPALLFRLLSAGLVGFSLNQVMFVYGLNLTTGVEAALISGSIPLVSVLIARIVLKEALIKRELIGLLCGFTAISVHLRFQFVEGLSQHVLGDSLLLLSVVLLGTSLSLSKGVMSDIHPGVLAGFMLFLGGLLLSPLGSEYSSAWQLATGSFKNSALFIFEILISTAVAWGLNFWTIRRLKMSVVSSFVYLQLPFSAGLAFLLNPIPIAPTTYGAFAGLAIGGYLIFRR